MTAVYKITKKRRSPHYFKSDTKTLIRSAASVSAHIRGIKEAQEYYEQHGGPEPTEYIVKIERSEVNWEEITIEDWIAGKR